MGVESSPLYPGDLTDTWPADGETRREGAAHIRNVKAVITNYLKAEAGTKAHDERDLLQAMYPAGRVYLSAPEATNGLDDDIGGESVYLGKLTIVDPQTAMTEVKLWAFTRSPNGPVV